MKKNITKTEAINWQEFTSKLKGETSKAPPIPYLIDSGHPFKSNLELFFQHPLSESDLAPTSQKIHLLILSRQEGIADAPVFLTELSSKLKEFLKYDRTISILHVARTGNPMDAAVRAFLLSVALETSRLIIHSVETDCYDASRVFFLYQQDLPIGISLMKEETLYTPKITPYTLCTTKKIRPPNQICLITGGLGGIAGELAKHLIDQHKAKVILMGRRLPDKENIDRLRRLGISAYVTADLSKEKDIKNVVENVARDFGPIQFLYHLAGVVDDGIIAQKNLLSIQKVLEPKIAGLVNLDNALQGHPVEQFVCFSSLSSLIGNFGQADYAAANAYMDAYVIQRNLDKKRSGHALSINWGLWKSGGMKSRDKNLIAMESKDALTAMDQAIDNKLSQIAIYQGASISTSNPQINLSSKQTQSPIHASIKSQTRDWIDTLIHQITGISNPPDQVSLLESGVDSIAALNIAQSLGNTLKKLGTSETLPKTILFDYSTPKQLTNYLIEKYPDQLQKKFPSLESHPLLKQTHSEILPPNKQEEDIAIIGMSCKAPKAETVEQLWKNLEKGHNSVTPIPEDRWDWKNNYESNLNTPNKSYGRHGGFISNISHFDPLFFGISPSEATRIDPQERLFLQEVYHALEDAGIIDQIPSQTGVFVSSMFGHYKSYDENAPVIDSSFSSIANRVSYFFDMQGPSIALDTMCSGSLTSIHLAVESLKRGECTLAIAGGVNLMPDPVKFRLLSQGKFLSPTGKCHSFGRDADGYVPGEGVVALILKPLSLAKAEGDRILGIIRATTVNSGGRTSGFTVPNQKAQSSLIQKALKQAHIDPVEIQYIEAHGTGTELGDPIEIQGLTEAFQTEKKQFCALGTIKSNIGHLESAAGAIAIVKVLLQFLHNKLVPSLHCTYENPHLNLSNTPFYLQKKCSPWPSPDSTKIAGVSSFGAGGSNAHIILEEFPSKSLYEEKEQSYLIPLSGKTMEALQESKENLLSFLNEHTPPLYSIGYTLSCGRRHFQERAAFIVKNRKELCEQLKKEQPDFESTPLNSLRDEYLLGKNIDWNSLYPKRSVISLPGYPFEKQSFWGLPKKQHTQKDTSHNQTDPCFLFKPNWIPDEGTPCEANKNRILFASKEHLSLVEHLITSDTIVISDDWDQYEKALKEHNDKYFDIIFTLAFDQNSLKPLFNLVKSLSTKEVRCRLFIPYPEWAKDELKAVWHSATGLLKSLALETGFIQSRLICLHTLSALGEEELCKENTSYCNEIHLTLGERLKKTYVLTPPTETDVVPYKKEGVYLISGGLGKLGQIVAQELLRKYQATTILLGSSPLNDKKKSLLKDLERNGGKVIYKQVDLSDSLQVEACIEQSLKIKGRLNGIFHSAGILHDGLIPTKDWDIFRSVLMVKAQGAANLDKATRAIPLDFMVFFSSISGVIGNIGQSDYASANAFLNKFAEIRQQKVDSGTRKGKTVSIAWPLWKSGGMQISKDQQKTLYKKQGFIGISNNEGLSLLSQILQETSPEIVVTKGVLSKITQTLSCPIPKVSSKVEISENIADVLKNEMSHLLQIPVNKINTTTPFGDYGFDSVSLQKFSIAIQEHLNTQISPNLFFSHNTLEKVELYLSKKNTTKSTPNSTNSAQIDHSIAIIGMDATLPGAEDLDSFWKNLVDGTSVIQPMSTRWPDSPYFGGQIASFDQFDPKFFGMSAREAMLMDPQHRIFLQTAYNTFVNSGYTPKQITNCGVFVGVQFNDYQVLLQQWKQSRHPYAATGNAHAMLANRISYLFDFHGPSQTIDTACSSTFVALNRAVSSLITGECTTALVGGVSLMIDPEVTDAANSMGVLSPRYRCATFDASADGYVRSEGVGAFLLKPLKQALQDGDAIHGIIQSVGENHGGRSHSLTAPNPNAQHALLTKVYTPEMASSISYLEAHGTGTRLGDPIEIDALNRAWKELVPKGMQHKIPIGSVKTHVGHLEPAAGVASLVKVLLSMKHQFLPANKNFSTLNPFIDLSDIPFEILASNSQWETQQTPRFAGISSFGFGGSNTHVVIEEPPIRPSSIQKESEEYLITLSAKSEKSLNKKKKQLQKFLISQDSSQLSVRDIAYTLLKGREHFQYRIAFISNSIKDLIQQLEHGASTHSSSPLYKFLKLYMEREEIKEELLFSNSSPQRVHLPGYPFDTQHYWFEEASDLSKKELLHV